MTAITHPDGFLLIPYGFTIPTLTADGALLLPPSDPRHATLAQTAIPWEDLQDDPEVSAWLINRWQSPRRQVV